MGSSLSPDDKEKLDRLFGDVLDPTLVKYLGEAKQCVEVDACRAAIVLAWCAVIYHLHRQAEMMGFDYFERLYRKQYPKESPSRIEELAHLREVKDASLLKILRMMGIINSDEDLRILNDFRQLRNDCAHAEPRRVTQSDVIDYWFVKIEPFVTHNPGADRDYRNPHYVADLVEDLKYELSPPRARGLIQGVRQAELLPLVDRLVRLFFSDKSSDEHRQRVQVLWRELDLDDACKIQVNRKVADALDRARSLSQVQVRQLVFWPQLNASGSTYCLKIISNLLPELQGLVEGGDATEDDFDILRTMIENSAGRNRQECEQLYAKARVQVFGPDSR